MKKIIAELFGTFCLVFLGCGTAMLVGCNVSNGGFWLTAFAFGGALTIMAYAIGGVSGCHINPAVSIAMLMDKRISFGDFIGYILAQFVGGIAGAAALKYLFRWLKIVDATGGVGANSLYNNNIVRSLVIEAILTCIFVFVVLAVTDNTTHSSTAGLVVGLALTMVHIFGIGLTGTSVNPARSLGPAFLQGGAALSNVWVFIVGPVVGGIVAAMLYICLVKPKRAGKR